MRMWQLGLLYNWNLAQQAATQPFHHLSTQLLVVIENVSRFFEPQFLVMVFVSWLNILKKQHMLVVRTVHIIFSTKQNLMDVFFPPGSFGCHHRLREPKNPPNLPPLRETSIHLLTRQSPTIPLESWWRNGNLTNLLRYPNTNTRGRIFLKGPCVYMGSSS